MPFLNSNCFSSCHLTNKRQSAAISLGNAGPDNINTFIHGSEHNNVIRITKTLCSALYPDLNQVDRNQRLLEKISHMMSLDNSINLQ